MIHQHRWLKGFVLLTIFWLGACSGQQESSPNQSNSPYKQLSNQNEQMELEESSEPEDRSEHLLDSPDDLDQEDSNQHGGTMGEQDELEADPDLNAAPNQPEPDVGAMQKTIPDGAVPNDNETNNEQSDTGITRLPFENFKEKWNAIADAQLSNLYIQHIQQVKNRSNQVYQATLTKQMKLGIEVVNNEVLALELKKGNADTMTMLTGWMQVINILHPEFEVFDVDAFFNDIGVGPNGDLSNLREGTFSYNHLVYEVMANNGDFVFRATYKE